MEPEYEDLFTLNQKDPNMSYKAQPFEIGPDGKLVVNKAVIGTVPEIPTVGLAASSGGLGTYGTYTNPQGQSVGVNKEAFGLINDGGAIDGTLEKSIDGIGDWGHKEWGTAGNLGLGVGQLGLGLASYFENKKTADAQRKLLGQQYASNAEAITDRRANKAALASIKIK